MATHEGTFADDAVSLFANDAVGVAIVHERIGGMGPRHRGQSVAPGLRTGYATVAVVVPPLERRRRQDVHRIRRRRYVRNLKSVRAAADTHQSGGAGCQHTLQYIGFSSVDGETVFAAHFDDTLGEPTLIPWW